MIRSLTGAACALALAACATAQDDAADAQSSEAVARAYMDAYQTIDWDRMAGFYADDAEFYDPGPPEEEGGVIHWVGRDAIMAKLNEYRINTGVLGIDYGDAKVFPVGDATVFSAAMDATYPGPDDQIVHWRTDVVTVVTVKDGKVVRHDDFPYYAGATVTAEAE